MSGDKKIKAPVAPQELLVNYEQMKEFASRDALTGLLNRGALEQRIKDRLENMQPDDVCALFILDLDHFKLVNDTLGHQAGDRVLRGAARILLSLFRSTDIVGRLGGDEFAVFLSGNITEQLVRAKGQMICDQVQFVVGNEDTIFVTSSVGIYLSLDGNRKFSSLYRAADQALYRVKNTSRQNYYLSMDGRDAAADSPMRPVSALRLRALLDNIDSGVAMIELAETLRFIYVSPSLARMLGRSVAETMELSVRDVVHPEDWDKLMKGLHSHVLGKGESGSIIFRALMCSGKPAWWQIHAIQVDENEQNPVILVTAIDISEMKEREMDLNDIYQVAIQQATQGIWQVDIEEGVFRMLGDSRCFPEVLQNAVPFPEGLLSIQFIAPECADSFREFAQSMLAGESQGYANFKVRYRSTGKYDWVSFSYRILTDKGGQSVRVMGTIDSLSHPSISSPSSVRETILPECLMASLLFQAAGSLVTDELTLYRGEDREMNVFPREKRCSQVLEEEERKRIANEEQAQFLSEFLSAEKLLDQYRERKTSWLHWEYLRKNDNGTTGMVNCVLHLTPAATGKDVHLHLWIVDLSRRRQWEEESGVPIYRMPAREFYTRTTLGGLGTSLLAKGGHVPCALVILEVKGLSSLGGRELEYPDRRKQDIITALILGLGGGCLPGQFSSDCFTLFFPKIENSETLKHQLEQVILFVRDLAVIPGDQEKLRFLAVGVCGYPDETGYDLLIQRAQLLLGNWRNSSGDKVVFDNNDSPEDDDIWQQENEKTRIRTDQQEVSRPLSNREKDAALNGLLGIFHSASMEESARCVLATLGEFYNADRVYILQLADQGRTVTMPHEWTSARKWSVQSVVSGTLTERYPLLERCIQEEKPVFLTKPVAVNSSEEWRFAIVPMREDKSIQGYLCVENARNHMSDATLSNLLTSCLLKERRKHLSPIQNSPGNNRVYNIELPNYTSYMESIYSFNSDRYQSLGVVCVDVPNFPTINNVQGFEYGRQILRQIVRTMTGIFGTALVYRTWDTEFIALCPNTTKQVFLGRCARLRTILSRNYPKKIRMGYNWADKVFSGKALADEAKFLMRGEGGTKNEAKGPVGTLPLSLARYSNMKEMIAASCFTVYFQPKIDLVRGVPVGVEALVRGVDEQGSIIPPLQFISQFEQNGSIRDLDFFVLDRVMSLMSRWQRQGGTLLPVSVNFSRTTLFDPCSPASVLAIQSRYPDLPEGLFRAEIAEGAGDIGKSDLRHAMEKFREFGLTFSLDDFGAKYSNLSIFTNVSFEEIKLDRSLIVDIDSNENGRDMVKSIVDLCRKNGAGCVAEGVETPAQAKALQQAGCTIAQGYYYERPIPEQMFFDKYLRRRSQKSER